MYWLQLIPAQTPSCSNNVYVLYKCTILYIEKLIFSTSTVRNYKKILCSDSAERDFSCDCGSEPDNSSWLISVYFIMFIIQLFLLLLKKTIVQSRIFFVFCAVVTEGL